MNQQTSKPMSEWKNEANTRCKQSLSYAGHPQLFIWSKLAGYRRKVKENNGRQINGIGESRRHSLMNFHAAFIMPHNLLPRRSLPHGAANQKGLSFL